ncbi:MAG: dTMP kinase [Firmicutes bacterium]|nr:dTMP kinase [Bacillota bacterium]
MSERKGIFITLEGTDGCGKTTQAKLFKEYFLELGLDFLLTREPGGTVIGEAIRQVILDPRFEEMVPETEMLLYAASRAQLIKQVILPALEAGKVVLCERYVDSSIAYQGYGLGRQYVKKVRAINELATDGLKPDLTFLYDTDPEIVLNRAIGISSDEGISGGDRIERRVPAYHARVRWGYLRLAEQEPERFVVLTTKDKSPQEIFASSKKVLQERFAGIFTS